MKIELQECMEQIDASINKSYELYDERHDYHKLISEILEMLEEGDAYTRWQQYGTWIVLDGRPFAETALSSEKERTERMKNKRPTLTLVNYTSHKNTDTTTRQTWFRRTRCRCGWHMSNSTNWLRMRSTLSPRLKETGGVGVCSRECICAVFCSSLGASDQARRGREQGRRGG
ncbi:uncharacterized protein [Physcomitrium patens]|uniref:uncharacterized protein isoform X1 n=1 Tax=Physcomitrium patens TaxID=3218 RepID=UPI003CCD6E0E